MNYFQGRWLMGQQGTERVLELAKELNHKTKEQAEKTLSKTFAHYEPWMCASSCFEVCKNGKPKTLEYFSLYPQMIVDSEALEFLYKTFASSPEKPFGHLDYMESGLRVEQTNALSLNRFQTEIKEAYTLVSDAHETLQQRLDTLVYHIIPLGPVQPDKSMRKDGSGLSLHNYRGGIFLGLPEKSSHSIAELAINLSHELGHQAAMIYQYADRILESDFMTPVYSAVRKTQRPALMSFHALVALAYMCEYLFYFLPKCTENNLKNYYQQRFKDLRSDFETGWQVLYPLRFTDLGKGIMQEFRELLNYMQSRIPDEANTID